MATRPCLLLSLLLLVVSNATTGCKDSEPVTPPSVEQVVRVHRDTSGADNLEVLSARYAVGPVAGDKTPERYVDFIGAVHLGEPEYFASLNKKFEEYDVVLFELVGDPTRLAELKVARRPSLLGSVQHKFGDLLGLSFQLDEIDYTKQNFTHADMTPEQMSDAMDARGESAFTMILKVLKLSFDPELQKEIKKTGYKSKVLDQMSPLSLLLRGPTSEERAELKRYMAHSLVSSDKVLKALEGVAGGVLISDRNAVAVVKVKEQLDRGVKKIAVYYGVGHLPDMNIRFKENLQLQLASVWWTSAWKLGQPTP